MKGSGRPSSVKNEDILIIKKRHDGDPKISAPKCNKIFQEKTNKCITTQT
jgi:hypothetical protein